MDNRSRIFRLQRNSVKKKPRGTALKDSENIFRTMIEQTGDAVFLFDHSGNFKMVNEAACTLLGYQKNKLLGLTVYDVDLEAAGREELKNLMKTNDIFPPMVLEARYQRADGVPVLVEVSLAPVPYGGDTLGLAIVRDITKRKAMDEKIRQNRKMEAITTLTAGIAHNFNNLLTVILGNAELAAAKISKDNPASGFLKKLEEAGGRAKEIVWQLIQFSQKVEKNFQPVRVEAVVEKEIQALAAAAKGNVKLIRQLPLDCAPVFGDPDQLRVMVNNLLTNSLESMKNGLGVIEVQLENMAYEAAPYPAKAAFKKGKYILLTIRDNGRGIDNFHLDRIFDPYFTTKDFSQGAGMGLAVVRGLVVNHNGSITVDSRVDKGTEIKVYLPAHDAL
jgi:PAS domain S-box-containing protein